MRSVTAAAAVEDDQTEVAPEADLHIPIDVEILAAGAASQRHGFLTSLSFAVLLQCNTQP